MKVVDSERSERGRQWRTDAAGRRLHCCCVCGKVEIWGARWSYYGSYLDIDEGTPVAKFCSAKCQRAAGPTCENITPIMRAIAKEAELREPSIAYREATGPEKYNAAVHRQTKKPPSPHEGSPAA